MAKRLLFLAATATLVTCGGLARATTALAVHCHSTGVSMAASDGTSSCAASADTSSEATADATGGSTAQANASTGSEAFATARTGSVAQSNASAGSEATSFAFGNSVAQAAASSGSAASACAAGDSVAQAAASSGSSASASASRGTVAQSSATSGSENHDVTGGGDCPPSGGEEPPAVPADLMTTQQISVNPTVGTLAVITVDSKNNGTDTAPDSYVKDFLPTGYVFVDCRSTIDGFPTGFCWWDGVNMVVDDLGDFAAGSATELQIYVRPTASGSSINSVGIGSSGHDFDPDSTNNFFDLPVTTAAA